MPDTLRAQEAVWSRMAAEMHRAMRARGWLPAPAWESRMHADYDRRRRARIRRHR